MGVLNLNGVSRKNTKPIAGSIFLPGLASEQHPTVSVYGRSYNSPFTTSAIPVFNASRNNSTQPHLPALKVESPGQVVKLKHFVKVHPNEKGSTFATNVPARPIVGRVGGPSNTTNTPANPNAPKLTRQPRPLRAGSQTPTEKTTNLSFLRSGGTLSPHANPPAGTSNQTSRWHTVKKGAVIA